MATTPLKYLHQYFTTTLNVGGGLTNSQTTGIVIQAVSGLDIAKPGVACLTYADPINTSTAEWITYTSIDGSNELQGVVRGAEGFGAKTHSNGAVVAFPLSESHINDLNAMFDSTGADFAQIATPANPSSGRNKAYFKSDDKLYKLTSAGVESEVGGGGMTDAGSYVKPTTDGDEIRAYHTDGTSYVEVGNDGTDSKVTSGVGHLTLTPASSKLVKTAILEQDKAGTNTYRNNAIVLTGWGIIAPGVAFGTYFKDKTVTFGVTFSTAPMVIVSTAGRQITPGNAALSDEWAEDYTFAGSNIGVNSFKAFVVSSNRSNLGNYDYIFTWIAIGTLA